MEMKGLFIALLMTASVIGMVVFYSDLGTRYGVPSSMNISNISVFNNASTEINATYKKITNTTTLFSNTIFGPYIDPIVGFTFAAIDTFLLFFKIPYIYLYFVETVSFSLNMAGIPIPAWFSGIIISIILVFIIMMILKFLKGSGDF